MVVKLNRDTEYALICLTAMVGNARVYSARSLAEQLELPYGLLCKILQRLSNGGVLESVRGPRGGYRLAHEAADIPLSVIVTAIHEKENAVPCLDERSCIRSDSCSIRGGVMQIQSRWDEMMFTMSLADFIGASESVGTGV
jgi:Rrf2 family transcriptional regulator, nitric oxide-sensitive transcriptional repressor